MDQEYHKIKRRDLLLVLVLGLLGAAGMLLWKLFPTAQTVQIEQDRTVLATFPLGEDRVYWVGVHNKIVIEQGRVFVEEATCPDQICVKHQAIAKKGESIICLPNKVVVSVR